MKTRNELERLLNLKTVVEILPFFCAKNWHFYNLKQKQVKFVIKTINNKNIKNNKINY